MKAYILEVLVIDHDEIGLEDVIATLEDQRYPNHGIYPQVRRSGSADIGDWHDDHPLNCDNGEEYARLRSITPVT